MADSAPETSFVKKPAYPQVARKAAPPYPEAPKPRSRRAKPATPPAGMAPGPSKAPKMQPGQAMAQMLRAMAAARK